MAGAQGGPADLATAVCLTATIAEVHETQATLKHATFALFKSEDRKVCCRGCNFPTFPSLKLRSMPSTFPDLKPKPQQICLLLRKGRPNAAWMYLNLYASSRKLPTITRQTYLNCACLPFPTTDPECPGGTIKNSKPHALATIQKHLANLFWSATLTCLQVVYKTPTHLLRPNPSRKWNLSVPQKDHLELRDSTDVRAVWPILWTK